MRSAAIAIVGALLLAACQHSDVSREVGARCDVSTECDDRCLTPSADYPSGFCTVACNARSECPSDTTCAEHDGGVCLFECGGDPDCTFLGAGWQCKAADLRGGGITVRVCRGR
jgi:hypothetical protein